MAGDDLAYLPPFSRPLAVDDVPAAGLAMTIEAEPSECEALAKDLGLAGIDRVLAMMTIRPEGGQGAHGLHGLRVRGEMRAKIRQICVVSLEPFDSEIVEPFDLHFFPLASPARQSNFRRTVVVEPFEPCADAEAITDGTIDLGQIAAEFLALGLDPHPRKPGVEFRFSGIGAVQDGQESPFSALQGFKPRGE